MRWRRVIGVRLLVALVGGAALLLGAPPAHAPGYLAIGDQVFTGSLPRQLTFTESIGGFAYSPDGKWIAYIAGKRSVWQMSRSAPPPEPGATKLCLVSPKGGTPIVLASLPAEEQDPPLLFSTASTLGGPEVAWSADSRWVAARVYSRAWGNEAVVRPRLLLVQVAIGEVRLIDSLARTFWWAWHPAHAALYLIDGRPVPQPAGTPDSNLYVEFALTRLDLDTGVRTLLVTLGGSDILMVPEWSAGQRALTFLSYYFPPRIHTEADTRAYRYTLVTETDEITREDLGAVRDVDLDFAPTESPDGRWAVQFEQPDGQPGQFQVTNRETRAKRLVARDEGEWTVMPNWVAWSPDSQMFLYLKTAQLRDATTQTRHERVQVLWLYQPDYGGKGHAAPLAVLNGWLERGPDTLVIPPAWAPSGRSFVYLWGGALWVVELVPAQLRPELLKAAGIVMTREQTERLVLSNLQLIMQVVSELQSETNSWPTTEQIMQRYFAKDWVRSWNVFGDPGDPTSRLFVWLLPPNYPRPFPGPDAPHIPLCYIPFPPGRVCVVFFNSTEAMDQKDWDALVVRLKANKQWPPDW